MMILLSLPLWRLFPAESWHDTQRYGQISIFLLSVILLIIIKDFKYSFLKLNEAILIFVLFSISVISSCFSKNPIWAFSEVAIFFCSFAFAKIIIQRKNLGVSDDLLIVYIYIICCLLIFKFILNYIFLENDWKELSLWNIIPGFDNPRFFGQFATLVLPLLLAPVLNNSKNSRNIFPFSVAIFWWLMIIASGTRGAWVGLFGATFIVAILSNLGRMFARIQIFSAVMGCFLYVVFFKVIPYWLGLVILNPAEGRLNIGLSAREILWGKAFGMVAEKPFLGFGPMHFADDPHPAAAHPHQMILQFASECGLPFAILLIIFIIKISFSVFKRVRSINEENKEDIIYLCLVVAVWGSLIQSMVDGVFIIPFTQIWFVICASWLFSIHRNNIVFNYKNIPCAPLILNVLFVALLIFVAFRDHPGTWNKYIAHKKNVEERFLPRFWVQGIINSNY